MRDQWYGDKRDLVKWGVVLELVRRHRTKHVLQVLYHRRSEWGLLEIDGDAVDLPQAVIRHFRRETAICAIDCPAQVDVIPETFENRVAYHQNVLARIRSRTQLPGIVFLDPDTGLEPRIPGLEHVLESELASIWHEMSPGDVLVFYQHQTNRNGTSWVEPKKAQFERALGIDTGSAGMALAVEIARDVAEDQLSSGFWQTPLFFGQLILNASPQIAVKENTTALSPTKLSQQDCDYGTDHDPYEKKHIVTQCASFFAPLDQVCKILCSG
jgi:hypothetical protein